jgi:hypothetical protein
MRRHANLIPDTGGRTDFQVSFDNIMKINLTHSCILISFFLAYASCSTGRIGISVLEPARIVIPASVSKVSIFPGAGIPDLPGVIDSIHCIDLDPGYNYNRIKRGYVEGIYRTMSGSPRFQKVVPADTLYEDLLMTGQVSWEELRQLCNQDSTDGVLILRKAVSRDTLVRYSFPGLSCGIIYRMINHTQWTFFQPFTEKESLDLAFTDTIIFDQTDENCDPYFALQRTGDILYDAFYHTGARMGEEISPTWHDDISRILFTGPGNSLRRAFEFAMNGQWNEAGEIWNVMAEGRNRRLASHASFNIAVAWEKDDDLDQAILWISHADSLFTSGKTLAYKKILDARLHKRDLLDQQMNRN